MSKITEYLKLIPKELPNSIEIVKALSNEVALKYNALSQDKVEEITKRRIICETCPFNSYLAKTSAEYKNLTNKHYETDRTDLHCSFCGCNVKTRTSGLSADCGIATWNKDNPTNQLPLKWTKYGDN